MGEEMEIELSMFIPVEEQGKLYKERFNFASHDCGASIVKTNREAKSANAILNENKDSYLLQPCNSNAKYVIIELCEDILVDEIEISNFEFYSSMFKDFRVSVSDRFPTLEWHKLGEFKAQNLRLQQRFSIDNSLIWTKFIKVEVLTQYGDEFYCPISYIQVFGTTMIEQLKDEEDKIQDEGEDQEQVSVRDNDTLSFGIDKFLNDTHLLDESVYDHNVSFSNVDYASDCIARPVIIMDELWSQFSSNATHSFFNNETMCSADEGPKQLTQKTLSSSSPSPQAQPQPKDSIYKNINKRLEELERNSSLSLLYQQEQYAALSDAFLKFESLQLNKFQNLIQELNSTHISHLNILTLLSRDIRSQNLQLESDVFNLKIIVWLLIIINFGLIGYILVNNKKDISATTDDNSSSRLEKKHTLVDILGVDFKFSDKLTYSPVPPKKEVKVSAAVGEENRKASDKASAFDATTATPTTPTTPTKSKLSS